jgi:hypothetical protein
MLAIDSGRKIVRSFSDRRLNAMRSSRIVGKLAVPLVVLLCVGCRKPTSPNQSGPSFEIREAKCDEHQGVDDGHGPGSWRYDCHATLLTRDSRYQTGRLVVWYEDVSKGKDGKQIDTDPRPETALMSDGVATVTGGAFYLRKVQYNPSGVESDPGSPQPEWKILGFARLEPVQVESQK